MAPRPVGVGLPSHETPAGGLAHPGGFTAALTTGAAGHPEMTIVGVCWHVEVAGVEKIFHCEDAVVVMSTVVGVCALTDASAATASTWERPIAEMRRGRRYAREEPVRPR